MEKRKKEELDQLFKEMKTCRYYHNLKKKNGTDCSLVNIYQNPEFYQNIPSIWTDWYHRLDSNIMIIGQDWGPYLEMKKFYERYLKQKTDENWNQLMDEEKSLTKKMLTKYLIESAARNNKKITGSDINHIFITNAIMCARKGKHYRGENISLKESTIACTPFLKRQIEIVNPKTILTLGYYPLLALSYIFHFEIVSNLTKSIGKIPVILVKNYKIIPLYHPTAQIKREEQLRQYDRIWDQ